MRLWIGLHLPLLPLETLRPRWSEPGPHVVIDQDYALSATREALQAGVRPGMRRASVKAICPEAVLHERDARREQACLDSAALALLQYTPEVALAQEHSLLMEVSASLRLFGGPRMIYRRVHASIDRLGFTPQIGMAPTARGAWLLARCRLSREGQRRRRVLKLVSLLRRLDQLPYAVLPEARSHQEWLQGIGCETLADLRRLPRAGLTRRAGQALLQAMDQAYGEAPELFDWIVPPELFCAALELPDRIDQAELLLAGAQRLIAQLTGWLVVRQLAVAHFVLLLQHERGRMAVAPTPLEIRLAEPAWQEEHLIRLLKERLGRLELAAPVIGLRLEALQVMPLAPHSEFLFPEPGGSSADFKRLLELLTARLGAGNILRAAPLADHRPEVCNRWLPASDCSFGHNSFGNSGPGKMAFNAGFQAERPFWLLSKPIALLMRDHRPFYGSPLKMLAGPERIECGWWEEAVVQRDYFIAQGLDESCYWIFRERGAGELQWFLHGLFA